MTRIADRRWVAFALLFIATITPLIAQQTDTKVYHAKDEGVTLPRLVREVKPHYTAEAMRAQIQGTAVVECVVNTRGIVVQPRIIQSVDATYGLDQEAIKAALQWEFEPGTKDGKPVNVQVAIRLTFTLKK